MLQPPSAMSRCHSGSFPLQIQSATRYAILPLTTLLFVSYFRVGDDPEPRRKMVSMSALP